jgi:CheY-like chemotaxis protein
MIKAIILADYPDAEITEAEDGKDAFSLLKTSSFNLIITDLEMEGGSGFTFIAKMQSNSILKKKKIIIFSSSKNPNVKSDNVAFIDKNSHRDNLKSQIKKFLDEKK